MKNAKWPSHAKKGALLLARSPKKRPARIKGFSPDDRAGQVPQKKAGVRHTRLASDRSSHGAEARDKFCKEQRDGAATGKVSLGLTDARRSFEGQTAEKLENTVAVTASEGEPYGVGDQAGEQHCDRDPDEAHTMRSAERSCGEQDGNAGDRNADLLYEHP